jgi:hypothetical protein
MRLLLLFVPALLSAQYMSSGALVSSRGTGPSYGHCKLVSTSAGMVSGGSNLSNYPLTVNLPADADLATVANGGYVTNAGGSNDIAFYSDCSGVAGGGTQVNPSGTKLTWEIESYTAATGALTAHVLKATLLVAGDSVGMWFAGTATTFQSTASSVWDSNYKGVWHLPSTLTGDSTTNAVTLTNTGGMSASTGQLDGAANGTGTSNSYFSNAGTSLLVSGNYTISAWVKIAAANYASGSDWSIAGQWAFNSSFQGYQCYYAGSGVWRAYVNASHFDGSAVANDSGWHHIACVNNGGTGLVYVDGVSTTGAIGASVPTSAPSIFTIGKYGNAGDATGRINGDIDEVRLSNSARTAAWTITEYRNQATNGCSGSPCLTVGALQ